MSDGRKTRDSGAEENVRGLPADELERRAHEHVGAMFDELRAAGDSARKSLKPANLLGKHSTVVAVLGGLAGLLLVRRLLGSGKSRSQISSVPPAKAESATHAFGRSFLSSVGGMAGKALPGIIFYGLARRGWTRGFGRGKRKKPAE